MSTAIETLQYVFCLLVVPSASRVVSSLKPSVSNTLWTAGASLAYQTDLDLARVTAAIEQQGKVSDAAAV